MSKILAASVHTTPLLITHQKYLAPLYYKLHVVWLIFSGVALMKVMLQKKIVLLFLKISICKSIGILLLSECFTGEPESLSLTALSKDAVKRRPVVCSSQLVQRTVFYFRCWHSF